MKTNCDTKDDKALCFVCCKQFYKVDGKKNQRDSLRLLFRHVDLEADMDGGSVSELETCSDCETLLESYGKIYHEWKCLELQLHWRIKEVGKVMQFADRVPKRMKAFRERCDGNGKGQSVILRSKLKNGCKVFQSKSMPKLVLARIDEGRNCGEASEMSRPKGNPNSTALFLGWLGTFVAVAALTDFNEGGYPDPAESPMEIPVDRNFLKSAEATTCSSPKSTNKCDLCRQILVSSFSLQRHMRKVHGILTSTSETINSMKTIAPSKNLKRSRAGAGPGTLFKCYICGRAYPRVETLEVHMSKMHKGCPFKITFSVNGNSSRRAGKLIKTAKTHFNARNRSTSGSGGYKCSACEMKLSSKRNLVAHFRRIHIRALTSDSSGMADAQNNSETCRMQPVDKTTLSSEIRNLKEKRGVFPCKYCQAKYNWQKNLARHVRKQHPNVYKDSGANCSLVENRKLQCSLCDAKYKWRKHLVDHVRKHHPSVYKDSGNDGQGSFPCLHCAAKYRWRRNLVQHLRERHPDGGASLPSNRNQVERGRFKCPCCVVKYSWQKDLRRHIRICHPEVKIASESSAQAISNCVGGASGEQSAEGGVSGNHSAVKLEVWAKGPQLNKIVRKDQKKKYRDYGSFPCSKCGKVLKTIWSMRRHLRMKSCHNSTQRDALIKLNATLDFICPFCNEDLKDRSALMRHVAGKHKFVHENARQYRDSVASAQRGVYFCPFCGVRTENRDPMIEHFKKNHWERFGVPKEGVRQEAFVTPRENASKDEGLQSESLDAE